MHCGGMKSRRCSDTHAKIGGLDFRTSKLIVMEVFPAAAAVGRELIRAGGFLDGLCHFRHKIVVIQTGRALITQNHFRLGAVGCSSSGSHSADLREQIIHQFIGLRPAVISNAGKIRHCIGSS